MELGLSLNTFEFRGLGHFVSAAVAVRLVLVNLQYPQKPLSVIPVILAAYYLAYRLSKSFEGRLYSWLAAIPVLSLLFTQFDASRAMVCWACFALALLAAGRYLVNIDLHRQSYVIAAATLFYVLLNTPVLWAAIAIVAAFYAAQALSEQHARTFFSVLATVLLTATLYDKVSGSLLTMAWGAEGLLLLSVGFAGRERILRLQGIVLFFLCIVKLFAYDMRKLETMYYILSFIALGFVLLGVSWVYARFREHIRRYL
jgi:uncharacterized membrane protein